MKIVCQLDGDGYFVGPALADESPLEPGVHLLPGGCVDAAPPAVPTGKRARWLANAFELEDTPLPPEPTPEELAALALAEAERAARAAERAARAADVQDARDDALVRTIAEMTPAQLVAHIDATFPGMTAAQRQVLKVLAKMSRLSAISLR